MANGLAADWAESIDAPVDDRGLGLEELSTPYTRQHGLVQASISYAIFEQARRARLGLSRQDYAREMGRLFAPFSAVAAANPYSTAPVAYTPESLVAPSERNRMIADPYTRLLVARDQVNQAAAVLIASTRGRAGARHRSQQVGLPARLLVRERARDHESRGSGRIAGGATRVSRSTQRGARDARRHRAVRPVQLFSDRGVQCLRRIGTCRRRIRAA